LTTLLNNPLAIFVVSFLLLWVAALIGAKLGRIARMNDTARSDFGVVETATLTLLGLIIGFTFSMAIARYDLRKLDEGAEANAISTAYMRADLLPPESGAKVRELLRRYTGLRIAYYQSRESGDLNHIEAETANLQNELWKTVSASALSQPSEVAALAVASINDVFGAQSQAEAAWGNRIPPTAWFMMFLIAAFSNGLLGYGARKMETKLFMVLPLVVATSFFLVADIDSPRIGIIRVHPQNLQNVQAGLR
jgi:hypothetical protein